MNSGSVDARVAAELERLFGPPKPEEQDQLALHIFLASRAGLGRPFHCPSCRKALTDFSGAQDCWDAGHLKDMPRYSQVTDA